MCQLSWCEKVKLLVRIQIASPGCHETFLFSSGFSKPRLGSRTAIRTGTPSGYFHLQTHQLAIQMPFAWEQVSFFHSKDFREELNLSVGGRAALGFDVREDVAGHVAAKQL
jgi:hypothetical protein